MHDRHLVPLVASTLLLVAVADPAHASHEESSTSSAIPSVFLGYEPSWFLMGGATGGASFAGGEAGGFAGAEVSLVRTERGFWSGIYLDGTYDFRSGAPSFSAGPEFGYAYVGLDSGMALKATGSGMQPGFMGRVSANGGIVSLYTRYIHWSTGAGTFDFTVQVGATFKLPLIRPWGEGATRGGTPIWNARSRGPHSSGEQQ